MTEKRSNLIVRFETGKGLEDALMDYLQASIDALNKDAPDDTHRVKAQRLVSRDFAIHLPRDDISYR